MVVQMASIGAVEAIALGTAAGALFGGVSTLTRAFRERAACLRAAKRATNDFYDLAEQLLADGAVPDRLKQVLYDFTLAVTDKEAGALAFEAMLEGMGQDKRPAASPSGLGPMLDALRRNRGDLYDDFHNAMRAAMASLMFSYGPGHAKVLVEFEATRNHSIMLALMSRIDRVISDWIAGGGAQAVRA
jgi:hypothetical protein